MIAFDPKAFAPTTFYSGEESYVTIAKLGAGSEHAVFRVQNMSTREVKTLKIGVPYAGGPAVVDTHRIIKQSGLPILDLQPAGPHANFVEQIPSFGSDVIRAAIESGDTTEIVGLSAFFRKVINTSPLFIDDLKPDNVGRRANGEWVITDWLLNPKRME